MFAKKGEGSRVTVSNVGQPLSIQGAGDQASETENKVPLSWRLSPGRMSLPHLAEVRERWLFFSSPHSKPPIAEALSVAKGDRYHCPALRGGKSCWIPALPFSLCSTRHGTHTDTHTMWLPTTHSVGLNCGLGHMSLESDFSLEVHSLRLDVIWVQEAPGVICQMMCVECECVLGKDRPTRLSRPRTRPPTVTGLPWRQRGCGTTA